MTKRQDFTTLIKTETMHVSRTVCANVCAANWVASNPPVARQGQRQRQRQRQKQRHRQQQ